MTMAEIIGTFWPLVAAGVTAGVGVIIWGIRLEGRVRQIDRANIETQKDVDEIRVKHESLDSKMMDKLSEISDRLARIEGKLSREA